MNFHAQTNVIDNFFLKLSHFILFGYDHSCQNLNAHEMLGCESTTEFLIHFRSGKNRT